jgi:hypothetical protein
MNALWEGVKATAGIVGQAAVETGMKGKLQAELLLISNEIENRKRAFGEELYEYVVSHSHTWSYIILLLFGYPRVPTGGQRTLF